MLKARRVSYISVTDGSAVSTRNSRVLIAFQACFARVRPGGLYNHRPLAIFELVSEEREREWWKCSSRCVGTRRQQWSTNAHCTAQGCAWVSCAAVCERKEWHSAVASRELCHCRIEKHTLSDAQPHGARSTCHHPLASSSVAGCLRSARHTLASTC